MKSGAVSGATQVGFLLSGAAKVGATGDSFTAGDAFVIVPGTGARLRRSFGAEMLVLRCAGSAAVELDYFDGSPGAPAASATISPTPCLHAPAANWKAAVELSERMEHLRIGDRGADAAVAQAVADGTIDLLKAHRNALKRPAGADPQARVACATLYVSARLNDSSLRKSDVGSHLDVSESLITLLFRKCGGIGLREHMILQRLERARVLLKETRSTVYEIAAGLGVTYQHFIRTFRSRYGQSPLRFRKLSRAHPVGQQDDSFFETGGFPPLAECGPPPASVDPKAGPILVLLSNGGAEPLRLLDTAAAGGQCTLIQLAAGRRALVFGRPGARWASRSGESGPSREFCLPSRNTHLLLGR